MGWKLIVHDAVIIAAVTAIVLFGDGYWKCAFVVPVLFKKWLVNVK